MTGRDRLRDSPDFYAGILAGIGGAIAAKIAFTLIGLAAGYL